MNITKINYIDNIITMDIFSADQILDDVIAEYENYFGGEVKREVKRETKVREVKRRPVDTLTETIQDVEEMRALQALDEIIALGQDIDLKQPIEEQVQEPIDIEIRPRRRRGRPITSVITRLRNFLINFRRTADVEDERTFDFKSELKTNDSIRKAVDLMFDILQPVGRERYVIIIYELLQPFYYAINSKTKRSISNSLAGYIRRIGNGSEEGGSDNELLGYLFRAEEITFARLPDYQPRKRQRRGGAFFKYLNNTKLDLTRQGIFSKKDDRMNQVCLIVALRNGGLDNTKINTLKHYVKSNKIPVCKLQSICNHLNICINLKQLVVKESKHQRKTYTKSFGNKEHQQFNIGLVEEHYFIIEKVSITGYALKNYYNDPSKFSVKDSKGKTDTSRFIDTFKAVQILFENKETHLGKLNVNELMETPNYDMVEEYSTLEYSKENARLIYDPKNKKTLNKLGKKKDYEKIVYLDFETDVSDGLHKPYLCHYVIDGDEKKTNKFVGEKCALDFLISLESDTLIYAHNAGYDFKFLTPYLMNIKPIMRGSGLICCSAMFHNKNLGKTINIYIKDSYKLITASLSKFGKMFQLEQEKELLPYSIYTTENISKRYININTIYETKELSSQENKDKFLSNCKKWNVIDNDYVDIIEYSSIYCRYDCIVLCNGLNKFRGWMQEVANIDIHDCVSIPSLVHQYFVNNQVYNDVYEVSGIPRHFIQKCVVGGRVMTADNKKIKKEDCIMNDFDAVSLYPSAMVRLGDIGGFLKGKPKVLHNKTYDFVKVQDGYFIKIFIKSVGKKYKFPLMTYKNDNGIRQFSNEMQGKEMFVDKITLEDLIKYHNITFDIVEGYYFNEGRNNKISEIIKLLFNERLKKKKEKNPIQAVYKLIMNSAYGKTLLKPIDTDKVIIDGEDKMKEYLVYNFDYIKEVIPLAYNNTKFVVEKVKSINNHYNVCHIGIEILSMSKRIMNEVICLAEDNGLNIYYQDTDSMHIDDKDIKTLEKLFRQTYGRELIGKHMGQFHSDFELEGCKDIVSKKAIFLGKKSYIDVLEGIDEKGEVKNGFHIRLKGIPNTSIAYKVNNEYDGDAYKLYEDLYNGKKITFDLLEGGNRVRFSSGRNLGIKTISNFDRVVCF